MRTVYSLAAILCSITFVVVHLLVRNGTLNLPLLYSGPESMGYLSILGLACGFACATVCASLTGGRVTLACWFGSLVVFFLIGWLAFPAHGLAIANTLVMSIAYIVEEIRADRDRWRQKK